jgi:malate dehydrogenase (oxaloacetate-decarboxylating)
MPVSLDVGTNNRGLLQNDLYLGWCSERMRGAPYEALVDEFVEAFEALFPQALIQWEDLRKDNALNILERYRHRVLSFNDDIQGTGAVALAGILSSLRVKGEKLAEQRILIHGAGAAGLGIARQIKAALRKEGVPGEDLYRCLALLDSRGMLVDDRPFADTYKAELAWPARAARSLGIHDDRSLAAVVARYRPTVLIGTSGQAGAFQEQVVRTMAAGVGAPLIMPMSNPTANSEALPADLVRWTEGRALIATGSPFAPVEHGGRTIEVGQGNNVFVFPGLGLGSLLAGAREVSDDMITRAAEALAGQVTDAELARGLLYPDVARLRDITAVSAATVCAEAFGCGNATAEAPDDFAAAARAAMWTPEYPTFL